jgi:hypothetical protein
MTSPCGEPGANLPWRGRSGLNQRADIFAPLPRAAVEVFAGRDGEVPRFVVHLPVITADLAGALNLAAALARSLAFMPEIDAGETTVSDEDDRSSRHRVFCDRLLSDRRRCALRADHDVPCTST